MKRYSGLRGHLVRSRLTHSGNRARTPLEEWYRRLSSTRSLVERRESACQLDGSIAGQKSWDKAPVECWDKSDSSWLHPWPRPTWVEPGVARFRGDHSAWGVSFKGESLTWTELCGAGKLDQALQILELMEQRGSHVSVEVLYQVLKGCLANKNLVVGRRVHALATRSGYESDAFVASYLIRMYSSLGCLQAAAQVFTELPAPDNHVWASMISAYCEQGQAEQAIVLYKKMRQSTVRLNDYIFVALLKACASAGDLTSARLVHTDVMSSRYAYNVFVGNTLVDMYVKCGSLEDARAVFDTLPTKDVVTWNAMLGGYARPNLGYETLNLYRRMQLDGVVPDRLTFVCVLRACANVGAIHKGQEVHAQILAQGLEGETFVGNTLVDMYAKCGSFDNAHSVFERLPTRDVATWKALIAGYAQHSHGQKALDLYTRMQQEGVMPDKVTLISILRACSLTGALQKGRDVHSEISRRGLEADVSIGSTLVDMYAKCGSLQDARRLFDKLSTRNVVTWTAMIAGYTQHGVSHEAINLYESMHADGTPPNAVTFVSILKACGNLGAIQKGREIHAKILERGLETDVRVGSTLLDMYAKCGSLAEARMVFDKMLTKNVVTWSAMIAGYAQHGFGQESLGLYETMRQVGVAPDNVAFMWALRACARLGAAQKGKQIHLEILEKNLEEDECIGTALVDMYAKCGSLDSASSVFDKLLTKNVVTWTAMIAGYAQHGDAGQALDLYDRMEMNGLLPADDVTFVCILKACASSGCMQKGKQIHARILEKELESNLAVGNALLYMYAKCGSMVDAQTVFDRLRVKDLVTWNTMIEGYAKYGHNEKAYCLYEKMLESELVPDNLTFVSALKACASMGALTAGKQIHVATLKAGAEEEVSVGSALVDMYAKCGNIEDARQVFDKLPSRDVAAWSALITGYGQHHNSRMAMKCFEEMQEEGLEPDEATFTCLISACSHMGLVDEGRKYFRMMFEDYAIKPNVQHYNCVVDLLGRAGQLDEANKVLDSMPIPPDSVGWMSLLNACKIHGDPDRARLCFERLIGLEPQQAASYALMSNIYADAGRWEDVKQIESVRQFAGAQKKPAKATLELNSKVHDFFVGEDRDDTARKLRSLNLHMTQGGHEPHTHLVLKPLSDKEKEDALCGHAEKLALAFGLLNSPEGTTLLVTKNLRMCDDCHSGTGILSRVERREIIVRDAHRVHHFCDGVCSCGDYP